MILSKNRFLQLILLLISINCFSQIPPPRHVKIKVFDKNREVIQPSNSNYIISAKIWSEWSPDKKRVINKDQIKGDKCIELIADYSDGVTLEVSKRKEKMVIHTLGNIDSIPFQEGEFFLNANENYLFSISLGKNQSWTNFKLNNFKVKKHHSPYFQLEESRYHLEDKENGCHILAKKIEAKHGGKNWADNTCVDQFQEQFICDTTEEKEWVKNEKNSNSKLRVNIYPFLKTKFIKHEFFLNNTYDHRISITSDNGNTWEEIMFIKNEWYVHIVYFPNEEKIGIDISNQGVILLSDYNLKEWRYYIANYDEEEYDEDSPKQDDKIGLVLKGSNWYDNYFGNFSFSE